MQKLFFSILFSLMLALLPFRFVTEGFPCPVGYGNRVGQQLNVSMSYSACEAFNRDLWSWNDNDKSSKNRQTKQKQKKKTQKEASVGYTIGGFILAYLVCDMLLGGISFTVSRSVLGIEEGEQCSDASLWLLYFLTGIVFFVIRCCINGFVGNVFGYSANIVGVLKGFDYCCWLTLVQFLINRASKSLGTLGFLTIVGYIAGHFLMDMFFG